MMGFVSTTTRFSYRFKSGGMGAIAHAEDKCPPECYTICLAMQQLTCFFSSVINSPTTL